MALRVLCFAVCVSVEGCRCVSRMRLLACCVTPSAKCAAVSLRSAQVPQAQAPPLVLRPEPQLNMSAPIGVCGLGSSVDELLSRCSVCWIDGLTEFAWTWDLLHPLDYIMRQCVCVCVDRQRRLVFLLQSISTIIHSLQAAHRCECAQLLPLTASDVCPADEVCRHSPSPICCIVIVRSSSPALKSQRAQDRAVPSR